ncbi:ferredoxin [Micromonospora craterilacus]|uniref:ferredoxin n=1 Tax=Micromonospora craterilacus TaxID=1655439 RepID=UPI0011B59CA0|nr:hypothetical protein [Micromonospora craterilacus]
MSTGWRIEVDARRCIGSGGCVGLAPAHFRMESGLATPIAAAVEPPDVVLVEATNRAGPACRVARCVKPSGPIADRKATGCCLKLPVENHRFFCQPKAIDRCDR